MLGRGLPGRQRHLRGAPPVNMMAQEGLSFDQAPPLSITMAFFLTAPLYIVLGGAVLLTYGMPGLATGWSPVAQALTHLGTLGFLGNVMFGAFYQMTAVVGGRPVPLIRLAHVVHLLLNGGATLLVLGFLGVLPVAPGAIATTLAVMLFALPAGAAIVGAPTRSATVAGMGVALFGLVGATTLGVLMALSRTSASVLVGPLATVSHTGLLASHMALGLGVWVGGLICAVSFQVVPMFYLAPALPKRLQAALVGGAVVGVVSVLLLLGADSLGGLGVGDGDILWVGLLPPLVASLVVHPVAIGASLRARTRKRRDASLDFWRAGLAVGLATAPVALVTWALDASPVVGVWLVLWGWVGLVMHGMLTRIVPFLVWFHRYSGDVGKKAVPPMRKLWPDERARRGGYAHLAGLGAGVVGLTFAQSWLVQIAGAALVVTGLLMAHGVLGALRHDG